MTDERVVKSVVVQRLQHLEACLGRVGDSSGRYFTLRVASNTGDLDLTIEASRMAMGQMLGVDIEQTRRALAKLEEGQGC